MKDNRRRTLNRQISRLRRHCRRLTRGTSRTTGVAMCLMLLSAAVVAGSHVVPLASRRPRIDLSESMASGPRNLAEETLEVAVLRELDQADYNESWLQAGGDADRLGEIPRRHQALITPDGRLTGQIVTFADWRGAVQPLTNTMVHLVQGGQVVAASETDSDGRFVAGGLKPGTYSLIAQSSDGLLAYGIHLWSADNEAAVDELLLHSMAASSWDAEAILDRVNDYWQTEPPLERTQEPPEHAIPEPVQPIEQHGAPATTLTHHQVQLQEDGRLIGRLRRLHPVTGRPIIVQGIEVALYRNGSLQGLTWTDEIGYFELPRVAPGVYSLAATGSFSTGPQLQDMPVSERGLHDGFLTFGIQVLPHRSAVIRPVAFDDAPTLEIDAALIDVADLLPFLDPTEPLKLPVVNLPFGTGGGAPAGGGGFVGGGHWGELLVAAAIGGLIPLLDDDDTRTISQAQP